jgi:hypothetical protein
MDKKLQVFVSSTYIEMKGERQAAVETILKARHIPAGMELFVAGDKSQLDVIKQWIQDSDVFMLILGGRYGSIEPVSGKSYIQVEYEFAASINKPLFAVVMNDDCLQEKVKAIGTKAIEQDHPDLLKKFKELVTSKMCSFFSNVSEIKLAVYESLNEIQRSREAELVGWVRASDVTDPAPLSAQIGQLQQDNLILREKLAQVAVESQAEERFSGYEFADLCKRLNDVRLDAPKALENDAIKTFNSSFNISLLQMLWTLRKAICAALDDNGLPTWDTWLANTINHECSLFGLVNSGNESRPSPFGASRSVSVVRATPTGVLFLSRLQREEQLRKELKLQGD